MYSSLPRRQQLQVRAALAASWAAAAGAGVGQTFFSPTTIVSELGEILTSVTGLVILAAAALACFGVAINRYRIEWAAAWFAAVGVVPYVAAVWALMITETITRMTQAFSLAALLGFFIVRAVLCAAHAAKLRADHAAKQQLGEHGDG